MAGGFPSYENNCPLWRHARMYEPRGVVGFRARRAFYAPSIRTILGMNEPSTSTSSRWLAITARMSL